MKDELSFHLQAKIDDLVAQGWSPEAARQEAERQFGDLRAVQQIGVRIGEKMERRKRLQDYWNDSLQDVRYTFRTLAPRPEFCRHLHPHPGARHRRQHRRLQRRQHAAAAPAAVSRLAASWCGSLRHRPRCGLSCATYSADAYEEFRDQSRAYQDVTGYMAFSTPDNLRLTGRGEPEPATSFEVIGNFFQVLGVQPAMGRLFTADESRGGRIPVALLANAYWRRQFNSDPAIVGKAIELNGTPITVVGVLPDSFDFGAVFSPGAKVDLFTPLDLNLERDWGNIVTLLGRLKPGVTVAQALDDANRVAPNIYFNVKYPRDAGPL